MKITFTEATGTERYEIKNMDTGAVRWDETLKEAYQSLAFFIQRGAKRIRVTDTKSQSYTEHYK